MAYIEIEKAIAEIDKGDLLVGNNAEWAKEILYRTPTAVVAEVVRCKDCKHATFYSCKNDSCYKGIICEYRIGTDDENFYCSYGERRTEMATCKDCIHEKVCVWNAELEEACNEDCSDFKNKADYAEVKHGKWIYKHRHRGGLVKKIGYDEYGNLHTITVDERYETDDPYCSECGKLGETFLNYCANCGAIMDGGNGDQ